MNKLDALTTEINNFLNPEKLSRFENLHEIFFELNHFHLGEQRAVNTDDILERYDNEEYWDPELKIEE